MTTVEDPSTTTPGPSAGSAGPTESQRARLVTEVVGTPTTEIPHMVRRGRALFDQGVTRPVAWRTERLRAFRRLLVEGEAELLDALDADLRKPSIEGWATDIAVTRAEIDHTLKHLKRWMRPEKVRLPLSSLPGRARIIREPLGLVLVISPWNYPVQLLLGPMAAAIAAGNTVIGKPSELAPNVAVALGRLVDRHLADDAVQLVQGGVDETTSLLEQRFDHILYTGNGRVARVVMEAAARHLTPVTLELGGKSPAIVAADADLAVAARRIAWGKWLNAGQTCIAPDYVLVDRSVETAFTDALVTAARDFYGDDPRTSPDYARIVNAGHLQRLQSYLDGGEVVFGGEVDANNRFLAPTVMRAVAPDAPVMTDEIFGPILPIVAVDGVDDAIAQVNAKDKPLALYVFSSSKRTVERVLGSTSSGGACVNHVVYHVAAPELPFGGVGPSGMGAYHGRAGFDTFSHRRSVLSKPTKPDVPFAYPPFTDRKRKLIRRFL
jgi:aldehyde dehydrogenase (NAD+)